MMVGILVKANDTTVPPPLVADKIIVPIADALKLKLVRATEVPAGKTDIVPFPLKTTPVLGLKVIPVGL